MSDSNHQKSLDQIGRAARNRKRILNIVIYVFLGIWALIVLFPFYWMILTSLKSYSAYNAEYIPRFFTASPTLQNYVDAFTTVDLGRYFLNHAGSDCIVLFLFQTFVEGLLDTGCDVVYA